MNDKEALAAALKERHPRETLEKALGRAVRNMRGKYEDYLRIIGTVRELAYARGMTVVEAAEAIVRQP